MFGLSERGGGGGEEKGEEGTRRKGRVREGRTGWGGARDRVGRETEGRVG